MASEDKKQQQIDAVLKLASMDPVLHGLTRETIEFYAMMHMAYMRVREVERPDSIIHDDFAKAMAGKAGEVQWRICSPGGILDDSANILVMRVKVTEDFLREKRPENVKQVVIMGDGLDTRAFQLKELHDCHVFELHFDRPTFEYKERTLQKLGASPVCKQRDAFLVDPNASDWKEKLQAHGFDATKPTYWVVEDIMERLPLETNRNILKAVDALSVPGSKLWANVNGGGPLDLQNGKDGEIVLINQDANDYGEDGSVFRGFPWSAELQLRRNQKGEYYGTKWDAKLFAHLCVPQERVQVGPFLFALFTKPTAP